LIGDDMNWPECVAFVAMFAFFGYAAYLGTK